MSSSARGVSLLLLIALSLASLPACRAPSARSPWLPHTPPAARPIDPWVLRCVLDGRPRMLVVALDRDLWAAYDTQSCTLAKTWRGDVNFDGPVYTTAHGPQPTSRGDELPDPTVGMSWNLQRYGDTSPAHFSFDPAPAAVSFLGHRFVDGHVQLHYALVCPDGARIDVTETIEAVHPNSGGVEFVRQFDFDHWPGWRPMLLGQEAHGVHPRDRRAAARAGELVDADGVHRMRVLRSRPGTARDALSFGEMKSTLHVRHDVDLHVPPRGVPAPAAAPEAE